MKKNQKPKLNFNDLKLESFITSLENDKKLNPFTGKPKVDRNSFASVFAEDGLCGAEDTVAGCKHTDYCPWPTEGCPKDTVRNYNITDVGFNCIKTHSKC